METPKYRRIETNALSRSQSEDLVGIKKAKTPKSTTDSDKAELKQLQKQMKELTTANKKEAAAAQAQIKVMQKATTAAEKEAKTARDRLVLIEEDATRIELYKQSEQCM